jgi:protein tyrosine/serine phosphatase
MSAVAQLPSSREIDNFAWIEPWLARGAEPRPAGYKWLAARAFKTVVNLRSHDVAQSVRNSSNDLEPIHIPVTNNRAPANEQTLQWLQICSSRPMRPIFVHCNAGEGRTSTFCALVRIAQGWPVDSAIAEQLIFGFDPDGEHKKQAQFLQRFEQRKLHKKYPISASGAHEI